MGCLSVFKALEDATGLILHRDCCSWGCYGVDAPWRPCCFEDATGLVLHEEHTTLGLMLHGDHAALEDATGLMLHEDHVALKKCYWVDAPWRICCSASQRVDICGQDQVSGSKQHISCDNPQG